MAAVVVIGDVSGSKGQGVVRIGGAGRVRAACRARQDSATGRAHARAGAYDRRFTSTFELRPLFS